MLTALQSLLARDLNLGDCLLLSTGLCAALGNLTTALNDFTGEPSKYNETTVIIRNASKLCDQLDEIS